MKSYLPNILICLLFGACMGLWASLINNRHELLIARNKLEFAEFRANLDSATLGSNNLQEQLSMMEMMAQILERNKTECAVFSADKINPLYETVVTEGTK